MSTVKITVTISYSCALSVDLLCDKRNLKQFLNIFKLSLDPLKLLSLCSSFIRFCNFSQFIFYFNVPISYKNFFIQIFKKILPLVIVIIFLVIF